MGSSGFFTSSGGVTTAISGNSAGLVPFDPVRTRTSLTDPLGTNPALTTSIFSPTPRISIPLEKEKRLLSLRTTLSSDALWLLRIVARLGRRGLPVELSFLNQVSSN
ncbi:hypothetical protein AA313_de0200524 [Arthrobotrys entomopaga]|nr:hypothetical protein AA313_de0200524 [Arthrobotrys entomopaga]